MSTTARKARRIKLYCPSVKKMVEMVAWDEQRLDLGSIALAFGLDPTSLKLNGHFISRGLDHISSSVTWNSLLSFFSAKRLSTGKDDGDALIVDGKLSRVGTKRAHDPLDMENTDGGRPALMEDANLVKSKKIREGNSDNTGKGDGFSRSISSNHGRCSPMSRNLKRTREDDLDEAILAAPYKKIR